MSYDLINLVKKLHKVRKNPERVLHVVESDPANFFRFHEFGIKEHAVVTDGTPLGDEARQSSGRVFVFHRMIYRDGRVDDDFLQQTGNATPSDL